MPHARPMPLALLAAALTACAPRIDRFTASPRRLCAGDSTTLAWRVKGTASLDAQPPLDGTGAVPSSGSRSFTPRAPRGADTTRFELTATRHGKSVFARQDVVTFGTGARRPIVIATAPLGADSLVARDSLPAAVWDDAVRIASVASASDRPLRVMHDGRTDLLSSGSASTAFAGSRVAGAWELRAALEPGERIGDSTHAPPDRLRLAVQLACAGRDTASGAP